MKYDDLTRALELKNKTYKEVAKLVKNEVYVEMTELEKTLIEYTTNNTMDLEELEAVVSAFIDESDDDKIKELLKEKVIDINEKNKDCLKKIENLLTD